MTHPSDRVNCPVCDLEFARSSIKRHIDEGCTKSDPIECKHDGCDLKFKTLQIMKLHFDAKHTNKTYPCDKCEDIFDDKGKLNYHKRVKHTISYHCPVLGCDEVRASKNNIENHINLPVERGGHGGVQPPKKEKKKVVKKRKIDEVDIGKEDPIAKFIRGMRDRIKDNVPDRICANLLCQVTLGRLSWGFPDGDKLYCNKHRDDVPGLINISKKQKCSYVGCDTKGTIKIGGFRFCIKHVNLLKDEGLPSTEESIKRPKSSGRICKADGCDLYSSFDDGQYCFTHSPTKISDDKRVCAMACCVNVDGPKARLYHPDYKNETSEFFGKMICTFGKRFLVEDAIQKNDMNELSRLMTFYGMNKITTLNAQSAFRFECEKKYYNLLGNCVDIVFDGHVHEGPKTLRSKRPDVFYKFNVNGVNFGVHIEYDEMSSHEDDPVRLKCIEENAGCEGRTYLIRVNGGHDTKNPACTRVDMANYSYYVVTHEGKQVASMVSDAVFDRIKWIEEGLGPDDTRPHKIYL